MLIRAALTAFAALLPQSALPQLTINPEAPKAQETVRVQFPVGAINPGNFFDIIDQRGTRVSMVANKITVSILNAGRESQPSFGSPPIDVPVGQFPAGQYEVEMVMRSPSGTTLQNIGTASFTVTERTRTDPLWSLTDLWWDPQESGWGFNIIQHPSGKIFATWFVYSEDRIPVWYVVPDGEWPTETEGVLYRGPIYRTAGPAFQCYFQDPCPTVPFDPTSVGVFPVGMAYISINPLSFDEIGLTIRMNDGRLFYRRLIRQSF